MPNVSVCENLQRRSFLTETPTRHGVIALDLSPTLQGPKRRGEEYRNASNDAREFHRRLTAETYGPCDPDTITVRRLALGLCKALVVTPCAVAGDIRIEYLAPAIRCLFNLSSTADIRFMADTADGFRLMQLACTLQDYHHRNFIRVLKLQNRIFAAIGVRALFGSPVSLHAGDERVAERERRTIGLAMFWMRLKVPAKGWTHLNKAVNYRYKQYKMWQHYIAVDRAILRYCFKLCKGSLGRMHEDVINDVEGYLYGGHSWPSFFFRDTYSRTMMK